jgi:PEP-CTERM motif
MAAAVFCAAPAQADNIVTGTWYTFGFHGAPTDPKAPGYPYTSPLYGPGSELGTDASGNPISVGAPAAPWVITLNGPGTITITDVELSGDQFTLFDNGILLGTTSTPVANVVDSPIDCVPCALNSPDFSHGIFVLGAGMNVITGFLDPGSPGFGYGDFIIAGSSAVPEPLTLSFFGAGLAAAAALRRRKKRTA